MKIIQFFFVCALVCASVMIHAQNVPTNSAPKKSGTIQGQVLSDDGQPVPGAVVRANAVGSTGSVQQALTAVANSEGKFSLSGLSATHYSLFVSAQAMVSDRPGNQGTYKPGDNATLTLSRGGVITGKVTNAAGDPLTGYFVQLIRVRDNNGRTVYEVNPRRPAITDDRGIYRIYGLQSGVYFAFVNRKGYVFPRPMDDELETFYPSATRDSAREIEVQAGSEVTGIDIRHREINGYSIGGSLELPVETLEPNGVQVQLKIAGTNATIANTTINTMSGEQNWKLTAIADGEYELSATFTKYTNNRSETIAYSEPRKIEVRGASLTDIKLKFVRLGTINGQVLAEAPTGKNTCQNDAPLTLRAVNVFLQSEKAEQPPPQYFAQLSGVPDEQGKLKLSGLSAGKYQLLTRLPGDDWFVQSVSLPPLTAKAARRELSSGLTLSAGQEITDLQISIAKGAATLTGAIRPPDGTLLPSGFRISLLPTEPAAAAKATRYYQMFSQNGAFVFRNIAPGKYYLLGENMPDAETSFTPLDATARLNLRKAAEAANNVVTLAPCERRTDFVLPWSAK